MKRLITRPGSIYRIPDGERYYFCGWAVSRDLVFFDICSEQRVEATEVASSKVFLRLDVNKPSINRAGWEYVGAVEPTGMMGEVGSYLYTAGRDALVYNREDGSTRLASDQERKELETLAVWDATEHIIPLMRFHFFREETPYRELIRSKRL